MSRYDLTDFEWRVIESLLPNKPRGVPRVDDRRVRGQIGPTGHDDGQPVVARDESLEGVDADHGAGAPRGPAVVCSTTADATAMRISTGALVSGRLSAMSVAAPTEIPRKERS